MEVSLASQALVLIFFFYGLAFFSMGLAVLLEYGRATDPRLRHALRPLAAFGLIHGGHEWVEMLERINFLPGQHALPTAWAAVRVAILAYSFLSLGAFGSSLLAKDERARRISLLVPLVLAGIWGLGLVALRRDYTLGPDLWGVADVWSRYTLAIPSALFASAGLIYQQRRFRQAGLAKFGQDTLWAAVAFAWYGVVGQTFVRPSPLPPSDVVNSALFLELFGFPVQLLRAIAAIVTAIFVIRFMRSFEVEIQRQIADLQASRLQEAEQREQLRGALLRRVVSAQEAERQRIARELHDETGQALTAIGLGLRAISTTLAKDEVKAENNLSKLENLAGHSLDELQRIISDLRPSHLDDLGIEAAIRWYASEVEGRSDLEVEVSVEGTPHHLASPVQIGIFRVAQEALNNVLKHANARNAIVTLVFGEETLLLRVADDGDGFQSNLIMMDSNRPSWGLMGMQERATDLGGTVEIQSEPKKGTDVVLEVPYSDIDEGQNDYPIDSGG